MIDIHTHILPGIDDGAETMQEAVFLAKAAWEDGITDLIATPHHANGSYINRAEDIREAVGEMNERLAREGIPLTVHPGQEIRVHEELLEAWSRGELLTLAGSSYILIEMPGSSVPSAMTELVHELTVMGLKPVIAHPERNLDIIRRPALMTELIEYGALAQITTHSLLGGFGVQVQKCAWILCRQGASHLISSDAHHVARRGFRLNDAYEEIKTEFGAKSMEFYKNNARLLLKDSIIEPFRYKSKVKSWGRLIKDYLKR